MLSYQFSYNGVTFNDLASIQSGNFISIKDIKGLSSPEVIHREDNLVGQHGIVDYESYVGKRIITLTGGIIGIDENSMNTKLDEFTKAFRLPTVPVDTTSGYHYLTLSKSGESTKRIYAKVHTLPQIDKVLHVHRMRKFLVALRCANPRIEANTLSSETLSKAINIGSLPMTLPAILGSGEWSNDVIITNNGNFGALPIITIYGPCEDPILRNLTYNLHQQFETTLVDGEYITINTEAGTATKNDGTDMLNYETDPSSWIVLESGTNQMRFTSADVDYPNGSCVIQYRDTWLSVPR